MDDCQACADSARELSHAFRANCLGCAARAVARGPKFHAARVVRVGDADYEAVRDTYRAELTAVGVTHQQVKEAAAADFLGKAASRTETASTCCASRTARAP